MDRGTANGRVQKGTDFTQGRARICQPRKRRLQHILGEVRGVQVVKRRGDGARLSGRRGGGTVEVGTVRVGRPIRLASQSSFQPSQITLQERLVRAQPCQQGTDLLP